MEIIAHDGFAGEVPWRLPLALIFALLIGLAALADSNGRAPIDDPHISPTLAAPSASCTQMVGQFRPFVRTDERKAPAIPSVCAADDNAIGDSAVLRSLLAAH